MKVVPWSLPLGYPPSDLITSTFQTTLQETSPAMADIKPPFTEETARKKVKAAQNMWNTQ
jgi:hypothetical protein